MTSYSAIVVEPPRVVVVYDAPRGAHGLKGDEGDQGEPGLGITILGPWNSGTTYTSGDAVTARSTAAAGISSLFLVVTGTSPTVGVEPRLEPASWAEIGPTDTEQALGGPLWDVQQIDHGFTKLGQPACFDPDTSRWGTASAAEYLERLALGFVREIKTPDRVILQSAGRLPDVDPLLVVDPPIAGTWELGQVYYLSDAEGMLQLRDPILDGWVSQPALIPIGISPSTGKHQAIITSWGPDRRQPTHIGELPPPNPREGYFWYRTSEHVGLYICIEQVNGTYWVQTNG